jgi:hypothetical protein
MLAKATIEFYLLASKTNFHYFFFRVIKFWGVSNKSCLEIKSKEIPTILTFNFILKPTEDERKE